MRSRDVAWEAKIQAGWWMGEPSKCIYTLWPLDRVSCVGRSGCDTTVADYLSGRALQTYIEWTLFHSYCQRPLHGKAPPEPSLLGFDF